MQWQPVCGCLWRTSENVVGEELQYLNICVEGVIQHWSICCEQDPTKNRPSTLQFIVSVPREAEVSPSSASDSEILRGAKWRTAMQELPAI
jgi:hypothetical protein